MLEILGHLPSFIVILEEKIQYVPYLWDGSILKTDYSDMEVFVFISRGDGAWTGLGIALRASKLFPLR